MLSITYLSSATRLMSSDQLVEMLEAIRPRNAERGLTGLLLYSGGNIIQTIEGPDDIVASTFADIEADPRHTDVTEAFRLTIEERSFPDWSMGFTYVSQVDTGGLEGFNAFLQSATDDVGVSQRQVRAMVRAFKQHNPEKIV